MKKESTKEMRKTGWTGGKEEKRGKKLPYRHLLFRTSSPSPHPKPDFNPNSNPVTNPNPKHSRVNVKN